MKMGAEHQDGGQHDRAHRQHDAHGQQAMATTPPDPERLPRRLPPQQTR